MILYIFISQGHGQITPNDKISKLIYNFCYFDYFVKFDHDTLNSKETRGHKLFLNTDKCHHSVINFEICH